MRYELYRQFIFRTSYIQIKIPLDFKPTVQNTYRLSDEEFIPANIWEEILFEAD